jgi:hypothetical protein
VSKKLTRAQRKALREKGELKPLSRTADEARQAERRAEEEEATARVQEAREGLALQQASKERTHAKRQRRDRTILLFVGLIAVAGMIFWLTVRSSSSTRGPSTPRTATSAKP